MSLREAQLELTRQKVLDAVLELVADQSMDRLSVPLVAQRSGVSIATIYRHFPTKDALLDAAAEEPARRGAGTFVSEVDDGAGYLRTMWASFAEHPGLVRHQAASQTGRDMRHRRLEAGHTWFSDWAARNEIDPATDAGARFVRLALLLTSSLAFLDLHDRQGLAPDLAADYATWAVEVLAAATRTEEHS